MLLYTERNYYEIPSLEASNIVKPLSLFSIIVTVICRNHFFLKTDIFEKKEYQVTL